MKERSYYAQQRREVSALIPCIQGKCFLDIGCGEGGLGRALKAAQSGTVVGIEIDPQAAVEAARHYDRVFTADMDVFAPHFAPEQFDHIVCADVLEHLRDPWGVLARLRPCLRKDGSLIASIPNIGNVETLRQLLQGRFDYVDWGIMDQSHLRFFTRHGITEMFDGAGYGVTDIQPKYDANADQIIDLWGQHDLQRRIRELVILMGGAPFSPNEEDLRQMLVIQYLVIAERRD